MLVSLVMLIKTWCYCAPIKLPSRYPSYRPGPAIKLKLMSKSYNCKIQEKKKKLTRWKPVNFWRSLHLISWKYIFGLLLLWKYLSDIQRLWSSVKWKVTTLQPLCPLGVNFDYFRGESRWVEAEPYFEESRHQCRLQVFSIKDLSLRLKRMLIKSSRKQPFSEIHPERNYYWLSDLWINVPGRNVAPNNSVGARWLPV